MSTLMGDETRPEASRFRRLHLMPRSLAARTSLLLIVGLGIVQAAGLAIHAIDHVAISDRMALHEAETRVGAIYRTVAESPAAVRPQITSNIRTPFGFTVELSNKPDSHAHGVPLLALEPMLGRLPPDRPDLHPPGGPGMMPDNGGPMRPPFEGPHPPGGPFDPEDGPPFMHLGHPNWPLATFSALPGSAWPRRIEISAYGASRQRSVSLLLPDEPRWVIVHFRLPASSLFGSATFIIAFCLMTVCGGALIVWGANRLIAPVGTLARAAEALGRNVDAPPLPEDGPAEIRRAALAFNTMASRIRRFVTDRTLMLTAIGHDLRTPITRLKLRAEFIDDDELRDKFLADLDEMEAMVAATLAFGRDSASREPVSAIDLTALLQTILDESVESRPEDAERVSFTAPEQAVTIRAQSFALKRALANLILNALKYGGSAHVTLAAPKRSRNGENTVRVLIEDDGPGLPEADLERMFEPFVRAETSRNRETGGTGLGLSIARTIVRGQGGDVILQNRAGGGLRVVLTLIA